MSNKQAEKREVRIGIGKLDYPMTHAQAKRHGDANMPSELKMAGFETVVGASDPDLHGGLWFRIGYTKSMPQH